MAVITKNPNNNLMNKLVLAGSQEAPIVKLPPQDIISEFCLCNYVCEYENLVFADPNSNDDFKNDKSSFLVNTSTNSATLQIILVDASGNETPITDDTLGKYYAKGTLNNVPDQLNYVGFIADWKKIYNTLGAGLYYFKFVETVFGSDFEKFSVKYRLYPFDEELAHQTIRLRFLQFGLIESGLNYTGLNWVTELRVSAKFRYKEPIRESSTYKKTNKSVTPYQINSIETFEIETYFINHKIGDIFIKLGILSDDILVTNYNLGAYKKYVDFSVEIPEVSSFKGNYELNNLGSFTFEVIERKQDTLKRNV